MDCSDERLDELAQEVEQKYQSFLTQAEKLHKSRSRYAKELNKLITQSMHELSMEKAVFSIEVNNETHIRRHWVWTVCASWFPLTRVNLYKPIAKVASGGELSRISLAIQVITAQK